MLNYEDWESAPLPESLQQKFSETIRLGQSHLFYKYKAAGEFTDRMITHRELWFSHPEVFNDPFEFRSAVSEIDKEAFVKYFHANGLSDNQIENFWEKYEKLEDYNKKEFLQNLNKKHNEFSRVYCMSLVPESILMWSYYANGHKGLCFGFDIKEDLETFNMPYKVEYPDSNKIPLMANFDNVDEVGGWHQMYTKAKCWEHEKEIRIYKFGEKTNIYCYKHLALREIIFGCNATKDVVEHYSSLISEKEGLEHVQLKQIVMDGNLFQLKIHDL